MDHAFWAENGEQISMHDDKVYCSANIDVTLLYVAIAWPKFPIKSLAIVMLHISLNACQWIINCFDLRFVPLDIHRHVYKRKPHWITSAKRQGKAAPEFQKFMAAKFLRLVVNYLQRSEKCLWHCNAIMNEGKLFRNTWRYSTNGPENRKWEFRSRIHSPKIVLLNSRRLSLPQIKNHFLEKSLLFHSLHASLKSNIQ